MSKLNSTDLQSVRKNGLFAWMGMAAVLVLALGLRLWGIRFGLPQRFDVDEPAYVLAALKLASGQWHIDYPMLSPNIHQFILLVEYGFLFLVGKVSGVYASTAAFAQSYQVDPTPFYLLSRLTSVFFSVLTVGLTYLLGRKLAGVWCGLAAAFFLAVFLPDVRQAHFGEPYTLISFFSLASVYTAVGYHQSSRLHLLLLSAAAAGAAVALRFSLAPILLAPALTVVLPYFSHPAVTTKRKAFLVLLVYIGLSALAGFILAYPGVLINPRSLFTALGLYSQTALANNGFEGFVIAPWSSLGFYLRVFTVGLGVPVMAACLVGLGWLAVKGQVVWLLVLIFPVCYFIILCMSRMFFTRYSVPLMPFLALLAGFIVVQAAGLLHKVRSGWQVAAGLAFCIVLVVLPLRSDVLYNRLISVEDTRSLAKKWIETNVPANAWIAEEWFTPDLTALSDPANAPGPHYKITGIDPFANNAKLYSVDEYRKKGIGYIVVSSFIDDLPRVDAKEQALRQEFYVSLGSQAQLLAEFKPAVNRNLPGMTLEEIYGPLFSLEQRQQPGPVIRIYRIAAQNP